MTHIIAPKAEAFETPALVKLGYPSLRVLSERAGLAPSTLAKFVRGQHQPTSALIANLLAKTGKPFDYWFRVVERPE